MFGSSCKEFTEVDILNKILCVSPVASATFKAQVLVSMVYNGLQVWPRRNYECSLKSGAVCRTVTMARLQALCVVLLLWQDFN